MYSITTAVKRIRAIKKRKKIIQGSSSAGKTIAILIILIDMAIKKPGLEISVVSESIPHLKKGALKDFIKIMKETGRWNQANYNATDRIYRFTNSSYMEFFSPQAVLGARRHVLYVNEANNILYSDYHQLQSRTEQDIFIDFNPAAEFWAHTEVAVEDNADLILLTYLDNEGRPSNVDEEFAIARKKAAKEKADGLPITSYWQNYVKVYVDGEIGNLQGVVFNNWIQVDDIPDTAELLGYGLDWGFTNDPTAVIAVYKSGSRLYVRELVYETELTNSKILDRIKPLVNRHRTIIADSAEPKSITDIRNGGYNVEAARKGPDSVKNSIDILQRFELCVTFESLNLIGELRKYRWRVDKTGKALNEPVDAHNHAIDAIRYVALNRIGDNDEISLD